ncbi:unnamed protein product [Ceutorhynchus assimilis]|uniref:Tetraspanin n=1 Tax=Ceutorhynchus assimilis TaxID=467358 RepID=A0A9N9MIU6_9CUCU|nr:unnamed protein product [Ceutorhynchus assimilis]
MCCTEAITRIILFVVNFVCLLVGVALLSIGVIYIVNYTQVTEAIPEDYQTIKYIPITSIVVGAIIFLISFLGCCGTLKSNIFMLTTYASILVVIFLIQVALGVFGLLKINDNNDLKTQVEGQMNSIFLKYNQTKNDTEAVDLIQQSLQCCGTTSSQFWPTAAIPQSCYSEDNQLFEKGCSEVMFNYIVASVKIIAIMAIAVSVTEVLVAILALALSNCIRNNQRKGAYY